MSDTLFKGSRTPPGLPRGLRRKFDEYDEALTRLKSGSQGTHTLTAGPIGSSGPASKATAALPVLYQSVSTVGTISYIPLEAPGTLLVLRLADGATLSGGGNLALPSDLIGGPAAETVLLVSDGSVWREVSRSQSGYRDFVPAALWGARPDTGADMTAEIQAAFDGIGVGETLYFEPGTYLVTDSLLFETAANIYAYGAIFSFGTTNLSADGYAIRIGANTATTADRTWQCKFEGLKVTRTYGTTVASLLYAGIDWCALVECNVQNCWAEGFEQGHFVHGGVGISAGNVHNNYQNLKATDCRYCIDIADGGASAPQGWSNENNYLGGRCHLSSTITDESPAVWPGNCHAIRIRYLGAHAPNNNRFYGVSLEGQWGRKIYCEGLDNWFEACRYENTNTVADVEFYDPASAGQYGSRNTVLGGYQLESAVIVPTGGNGPNFDGSGRNVNLNKVLNSAQWILRGGTGASNEGALTVSNSTGTNDAISVDGVAAAGTLIKCLGLSAGNGTTYSGQLVFRDPATGLPAYYFRMKLGTPNVLVVSDASGVDVGHIYINSSNHFVFQNILGNSATKGCVEIIGGHSTDTLVPGLKMRSAVASANTAAQVAASGGAYRIGFVAEAGGGILGKIDFESGTAASEVVRNSISMDSGSPYKLNVVNGLRLNSGDTTAGDVVWMNGLGTPLEGFKLNATTQRVQVGGITPASTDGSLVTSSLSIKGRLDLYTASSGSSPVTVGVDDCYIGLTAGTITVNLPAVANVSDGHVLLIKDESGSGGHTIDGNASELIDGALTQPLGAYASMTLVKRNSAWWIV